MGRIHAVLRYYLLPSDPDVDAKSVKTSFEVGEGGGAIPRLDRR